MWGCEEVFFRHKHFYRFWARILTNNYSRIQKIWTKLQDKLEKLVKETTEELREKGRQLIEAERLAALGKIANRVAHELRNPLTVIGGFSRRIYEKTPNDDPNKKYLARNFNITRT